MHPCVAPDRLFIYYAVLSHVFNECTAIIIHAAIIINEIINVC